MANIALVSSDTVDQSPVLLKSLLIGGGHTVSDFDESGSDSLNNFDLIITTRLSGGSGRNNNIIAAFNLGVPVIVGMSNNVGTGIGVSSDHLAGKINLLSSTSVFAETNVVKSLTGILGPNYSTGKSVTTHSGLDYACFTTAEVMASGATAYFDYQVEPATRFSVAIAANGSMSLSGEPFPASCAFVGFLYASNRDYTSEGASLILAIVDEVLKLQILNTHTISGIVTDEQGNPLANKLFLYKHEDGSMYGELTPDVLGNYLFKVVKDTDFFIVCASTDPEKNFKIHSFVRGVLL